MQSASKTDFFPHSSVPPSYLHIPHYQHKVSYIFAYGSRINVFCDLKRIRRDLKKKGFDLILCILLPGEILLVYMNNEHMHPFASTFFLHSICINDIFPHSHGSSVHPSFGLSHFQHGYRSSGHVEYGVLKPAYNFLRRSKQTCFPTNWRIYCGLYGCFKCWS